MHLRMNQQQNQLVEEKIEVEKLECFALMGKRMKWADESHRVELEEHEILEKLEE